jgi:protein ImuB
MRVICLLLQDHLNRRSSLAEASLVLTPQVAVGSDAVFLEISASHHLFTETECVERLQHSLQVLGCNAKFGFASDPGTALAFARYGLKQRDQLPVAALGDFLHPFAPAPWAKAELLEQLGIRTLGDFLQIPRQEIASRFGKEALFALSRVQNAGGIAWPRFAPEERIEERVDFDCAAQIHNFEPVAFLLKTAVDRVFLRLHSRRLKLAQCQVNFHLNRFSEARERRSLVSLPIPQSDSKNVFALLNERLRKELELEPLENSLEGISLSVTETAPFPDAQRDFFSKTEEEHEAWGALVARLRERLGEQSSFLAIPTPRLLPEASWQKGIRAEAGTLVDVPLRPLRLLNPPVPLRRLGDRLSSVYRNWKIQAFEGPEKLMGEWWTNGFQREYFRVRTQEGATLWVFSTPAANEPGAPRRLYLHGIFD